MDPLTALGLAANVFACISFASDLIKGTIEISTSPNGCSADVSKLESVYNDLEELCTGLAPGIEQQILDKDDQDDKDHVRKIAVTIKSLSEVCQKDCNELLQLLSRLKPGNGLNGRWNSFRTALRTVWEKKTIDDLEERLSKTQQTLTLHICTLANYACRSQSHRLEQLQRQSIQLQSNQENTLNSINKKLDDVKASIKYRKAEDAFTTKDIGRLKERLHSLSLSEKDVAREQSILRSLTFDSRPIRHEQIPMAHAETFKWALESDPNHSGSMIGEWLAKGTGIFWIAGKPGSGKSTLMKLMADSRTTSELVNQWAQPSTAIIASHYFWIAGTPMQKSHQGLLQTLLYEIFRQCPSLILKICSTDRWANANHKDPWSLSELCETVKSVSSVENIEQKFCFFIDGMDEFNGDHTAQTELCRTLKELASSGNIKLVLSSRPWNIFEEQFGSVFPKLYVQDLTHDDIQAYAQSSLQEHERWALLCAKNSQGHLLVSEITGRSNGVFLWVFLVTKLLKNGLTNRDGLSDLLRRLRSFPTELEPFFKNILESVEPFYHSHMSTVLQIALHSSERTLGLLEYHFHMREYEDLDYAVNIPVRMMDERDLEEIKSDTKWHLESRTRGLLEVHPQNGSVNFLHRTARDFLETREMHDFLVSKVDDRLKFNPNLSLLKASVALMKISPVPTRIERVSFAEYKESDSRSSQLNFLRPLQDSLRLAEKLELDVIDEPRYRTLLTEIERSTECLLTGYKCAFTPPVLSRVEQTFFREQLIVFGLFDYIRMRLESDPTYLASVGSSLPLCLLTSSWRQNRRPEKGRGIDFFAHILEKRYIDWNAADCCGGTDPWAELLSFGHHGSKNMQQNAQRTLGFLLEKGVLLLLLKAGADPNRAVYWDGFAFISHWHQTRPAAVLYLQLCFEYLNQSFSKQELYLDVLEEFLRLSHSSTIQAVCEDFALFLSKRTGSVVPQQHLAFLSKVNDCLLLKLDQFDCSETRLLLDKVARQVIPAEMYAPLLQSTTTSRIETKRKNESDDVRSAGRRKI